MTSTTRCIMDARRLFLGHVIVRYSTECLHSANCCSNPQGGPSLGELVKFLLPTHSRVVQLMVATHINLHLPALAADSLLYIYMRTIREEMTNGTA